MIIKFILFTIFFFLLFFKFVKTFTISVILFTYITKKMMKKIEDKNNG
jgi:hypothetical protein